MDRNDELTLILRKHKEWLESGKKQGMRADLSGASLNGVDLSGAQLSGADLRGAALRNADLSGAKLVHTDFTEADLAYANLAIADLLLADFTDADLSGANLSGTTPAPDQHFSRTRRGPRFKGADLSHTNLSGAYCYLSDFSGAKLTGTHFTQTFLSWAKLAEVDLSGNDFTGAILSHTNLSGANLKQANLQDAMLLYADLSGAKLGFANLQGADLKAANLDNAHVEGVRYDRKGSYRGIRVASCYGSPRFRRFAQDQDFIEEFKESHRLLYYLWQGLTDCGRSMARVICWSVGLALLFGLLFFSLGEEAFTIANKATLPWGLFTMMYYSVVTFTTLGFGDITPKTPLAATLVMMEVIVGYLMLGMLISILADKVARRS